MHLQRKNKNTCNQAVHRPICPFSARGAVFGSSVLNNLSFGKNGIGSKWGQIRSKTPVHRNCPITSAMFPQLLLGMAYYIIKWGSGFLPRCHKCEIKILKILLIWSFSVSLESELTSDCILLVPSLHRSNGYKVNRTMKRGEAPTAVKF